jgi:hypothetical protein
MTLSTIGSMSRTISDGAVGDAVSFFALSSAIVFAAKARLPVNIS